MATEIDFGNIILKILVASLVITLSGLFIINITPTYNEYYTIDDAGNKLLVARETVNVWDGTAKMRAKSRTLDYVSQGDILEVIKTAYYKDNITVIETKLFSKNNSELELFPLNAYTECYNCEGKIVSFTYEKLIASLPEADIQSPFYFEPNMKLEWSDGAYYAKSKNYSTVPDKIIIKYRPEKSVEKYYVKLVDPVLDLSKEDIVQSSEIVWESPLRACVYRNYTNPTSLDYVYTLEPSFNLIKGFVYDEGVEIKEYFTNYKIKSKCEKIETKCSINETTLTTDSICYENVCEDVNVSYKDSRWIEPESFNFEKENSYELRQCVKRNNVLDNFIVEVHTPFLGYDLEEYTTISSIGYNQTIYNFKDSLELLWTMDNIDVSGTTIYDKSGNLRDGTLESSPTTGQTGYLNESILFSEANLDYISVPLFDPGLIVTVRNIIKRSGTDYDPLISYDGSEYLSTIWLGETAYIKLYAGSEATSKNITWGTSYFHDVFVTRNGANVNFFHNGVNITNDGITDATTACRIQRFGRGTANYLDGYGDEVSVWSRILSNDEIIFLNKSRGYYNWTIYGEYNVSGTFDTVNLQVNSRTGKTCDSIDINISTNSYSFEELSGNLTHEFSTQTPGFYLRINMIDCENVFIELSNYSKSVVNLISPPDNYITGSNDITFNGFVYSDSHIENVSLYINGSLTKTNSSGINNTNYVFNNNFNNPGDYNWSYEVCDNRSVCTFSSSRNLTIQNNLPIITQISPADNYNISIRNQEFVCYSYDVFNLSNVSLYLNGNLNLTNTSPINGGNTLFNLENINKPTSLNWSCEACDGIGQCNMTVNRTFYIYNDPNSANLTILFEGLDNNLTYEFGTNANITILTNNTNELWCLNISTSKYRYNYICNNTNMSLIIPMNFLEYTTFSDGSSTQLLSFDNNITNVSLNIYEYDDLGDNLLMNINSISKIYDLIIKYNNKLLFDFIYPLINNKIKINRTSNNETEVVFNFGSLGEQSFGIIIPPFINVIEENICSINMSGYVLNNESFSRFENFQTNEYISYYYNDLDNTWIFDDFDNSELETYWKKYKNIIYTDNSNVGDPTDVCVVDNNNNYAYVDSTIYSKQEVSCSSIEDATEEDSSVYIESLANTYYDGSVNLNNYNYVKIYYSARADCYCSGGNAYRHSRTSAETYLKLIDGSGNTFELDNGACSDSCSGYVETEVETTSATFELKRAEGSSTWYVYKNSVFLKTIPVILSRTLGFYLSNSARDGGDGGYANSYAYNKLNYIQLGGIGLRYFDSSPWYYNNTYFNTTSIHNFTQPFKTVIFDSETYEPSGSKIYFNISNDGISWKTAQNGISTVFDDYGDKLFIESVVDKGTYSGTFPPHIINYKVTIINTTPINASIDFGGDGVYEFDYTQQLNETPIKVNFSCSDMFSQSNLYCNSTYCSAIPTNIKVGSEGIIKINDINYFGDVSKLSFNKNDFSSDITENPSELNISFEASSGNLNITNLSWNYVGNGNITFSLYNKTQNDIDTKIAQVRYSDHSVNLPAGINYLEFIPSSISAKNVQPYGQTSTKPILNITTDNGLDNMNFSMYLNDSLGCVDVMYGLNSNVSESKLLTSSSWIDIFKDKPDDYSQGIWLWVNLSCSYTQWYLWDPTYSFRGCCVDCVCSEDLS